ncbi:response regulator transcription factor [Mesorhizobium sp. B1-1-8]|uniref:response regulator transcription factor n=1 Tax=Mesorhizobium sp. B1-1-8 TaxID=2589976 RepID=UPI001D03104C|nr:response regulator [Mesorhizobium sp. B1-1-8]UCI05646.1 response regulator [Mesorhizobium sp. B1-1-8]
MQAKPLIVAVVDDDPSLLKGIQRLLSAQGIASEVFASAEAFLSSSAASRVACLVLDIQLGAMNGFELQRQLADSGSKIPIIFMTAFDNEATHLLAVEAGCTAYLHKPFSARLFFDAIERAVANSG